MILHGVTASALGFAEVADAIAHDGWTVDALDLPGHGATRWIGPDGEPLADQESVGAGAYDLEKVGRLVADAVRALPPAVPSGAGNGQVRPRADDAAGADGAPAWPAASAGRGHGEPAAMIPAGGSAAGGSAAGESAAAPVILGHSWGSGVAMAAIDAEAPAERLVLLDPPFLTPDQGIEMAEGFRAQLADAQLADGVRWERAEVAQARAFVTATKPGLSGDEIEARVRELTDTSPGAVDAIARGAPMDPIGMMASWRSRHPDLPVDVIAGDPEAGGLVPHHVQGLLRMALGDDRVHVLDGLGHSPQHEDVGRLLDVLRAVLRSAVPEPG